MQKFPHGLVPRWWNYALLQKLCNHFQEATQVPLPPVLVIGSHQYHLKTHQEPAIFMFLMIHNVMGILQVIYHMTI